eukprot:9832629-Ditylum_brightwellii.AAC.1
MENINQPIPELYLVHASAQQNARILPNEIPSIKELQEEEILCKQQVLADVNKDNSDLQKTYMVIG